MLRRLLIVNDGVFKEGSDVYDVRYRKEGVVVGVKDGVIRVLWLRNCEDGYKGYEVREFEVFNLSDMKGVGNSVKGGGRLGWELDWNYCSREEEMRIGNVREYDACIVRWKGMFKKYDKDVLGKE